MNVPLLDLKSQNLALEAELNSAFTRVLRSGQYILGPEVMKLEGEIARLVEVKHAIGVSSGTDAILLALMALGVGPGDEVICPTFTFFATAGCIARVGAKPVFVDSCPVCFNLDVADLERKITPRTKTIIPVHLFGQAAEMDAVMAAAQRHGVTVIEDAAQALGAGYRGRKVGSIGHFGAFSFFPSKNLGGFGDGGMLVTNDEALAEKARLLRTHGSKPKYYHKYVGGNFRMDPLQAALLGVKLPHYHEYTQKRKANASYYTDNLSKIPGVGMASAAQSKCPPANAQHAPSECSEAALAEPEAKLILPGAYAWNDPIWNQYTLRISGEGRRDALKSFLAERGIGTEIYYPVPMHLQECFSRLGSGGEFLPCAARLAKECLSIPIFPELSRIQIDAVIGTLQQFRLQAPAHA
ncbi:MAG: DegT/DnrJ/EryC1/StrS family aminotransferase [Chloroflexi bacterium]|nr:DegT/DnrJ/EryC1/StrS family aminotransferase [Chloroflexota bacterium]